MKNHMDLYQQYIHMSRYSRWRDELGRRETWPETVQRYIDFFDNKTKGEHSDFLNNEIKPAIANLEIMPSMRALMSAGPALEKENICGFNCAFIAINEPVKFSEALNILMCGTGVGFSCERQFVSELPTVELLGRNFDLPEETFVIEDSRGGWVKAFRHLIDKSYAGEEVDFDFSKIRPAGAPLKTMGGRSSGPEPLRKLFKYTVEVFKGAQGRKLSSIEVHDLMCMIAEIVVVGGVRRSALISLSNLSDQRMRDAKSGAWWETASHRGLANNSVAYTEKPSAEIFMQEWLSLVKSKSGERGIFNRQAAQKQAAKFGRRSSEIDYGTNPCSEIILRDRQFCNLTEVIVRSDDTYETLLRKVKLATALGTFQATLTDFNEEFVSPEWAKNTAEEALLGVSLTGIMDNRFMSIISSKTKGALSTLKGSVVDCNREWAAKLGINPSAATTCVKPSGTVSQLCDTASGIHARHSNHYIRTVRVDKKDPLYSFMQDKGFVLEDDQMRPDSTAVASFPIKAPSHSVTRNDLSAIHALNIWLMYQRHWCEHKPSVTITVRDEEWMEVGAWVYKHFDEVSGISFLPHSDHTYAQAPYQDLTEQEYNDWVAANPLPEIDWTDLADYEKEDNTVSSQTLACTGANCELP